MKHLLYRLVLLTLPLPLLTLPLAGWAQPTITSVTPGGGPLDASVTVTGTNLSTATSLLFGAVPTRLTGQSATQLTFRVPRQAVGQRLRVSTTNGTALSAATFGVTRPSTSPVFAGGTSLTTNGTTALDAGSSAAPAVTDVDGDGLLDLLVGDSNGNVRRFEQTTANGSAFADQGLLTIDGTTALDVGYYAALTVTDFDGDGRLDLLVGDSGGNVRRYEQTAANATIFADNYLLTTNGLTNLDAGGDAAPTVTDLDNDGLLDLLVGNQDGNVRRYEQLAANANGFADQGLLTTNGTTALDAGSAAAPAVTDVDGDGRLDLLVGDSNGNLRRFEQTSANGGVFADQGLLTTNGTTALSVTGSAAPTVTDVNGDGLLDLLVGDSNGFVQRYEQPNPPTVPTLTSLNPGSGAAGTVVTLTGTDLTGTTAVTFAGPATGAFTVVNATTITVTVPAGATTGNVTVTTPAGTSNGLPFTVLPSLPPTITSFTPGGGPVDASVTVTGTNLATATSLLVGAVPARLTGQSATQLTFNMPRQAVSQRLRVTSPSGTALSAATFGLAIVNPNAAFAGGTNLTTDGTTALATPTYAAPTVTDLDGDGLLDLIVGNQSGNLRRFEQTTANGSVFADLGLLTTNGTTALSVGGAVPTVTDLDGDGLLDLLVGSYDGYIRRFEQTTANGSAFADQGLVLGYYNAGAPLDVGDYAAPNMTDFDGDGLLDLIVGNQDGDVYYFRQVSANSNSFNGGLLQTSFRTTINVGSTATPTVTDMDGNGRLDLLIGNNNGTVTRYQQPAANSRFFDPVGDLYTGGAALDVGTFSFPTVTDVDGDGLLDLLVGNYAGNVQRFEQTAPPPTLTSFTPGSGPLDATVTVTGTNLTDATSLLVGGVPARLTGQSTTQVTFRVPRQAVGQRLRVSTPTGTALSAAAFGVTRPNTSSAFAGGANLTTNGTTALDAGSSAAPAVTDVDGDGLLDLLTGDSGGNVRRFEQTTANGNQFADQGLLTTNGTTALSVGSNSALTVTDLDGDGLLDLLVGNNSGNVERFEQTTANGSVFASLGLLTTNGNNLSVGSNSALTVTDLDDDGLLDLLVGNNGGTVRRFEQTTANGNQFADLGNLTTDGTTALDVGANAAPTVTDVDGDGQLDLLVGNSTGSVWRFEQTAANDNVFAYLSLLTTNGTTLLNAGSGAAPTVTDVDGDGRLDLLVGNGAGNVQRYEQTTATTTAPPPTLTGLSPSSGAVGTVVTLTGTGLNGALAVTFAGPATGAFTVVNATTITVTVPAGATTGNVTVNTPFGTSNGLLFTVLLPTITSFTPGSGPLDASVTVTGTNLATATSLLVGAVPARLTGQSATQLTFRVPRQAVGQRLRVSTPNGTALSAATFGVTRPSTSPVFAGGASLTTNGTTALGVGYFANPTVTDVDGDGRLDLLVGNEDGNVRRFEQTTANGSAFADLGLLTTNGTNALYAGSSAAPVVTDLDGDGLLDLLVGNYDGNVQRYEQTTANGSVFADLGPLTTNGTTALDAGVYATPTMTDVDGDGLLDLLVGNDDGNVQRFEQTAANGSAFADLGLLTTNGTNALDVGFGATPAVTDVDGDGLLDLLIGDSNGNVRRFEQTTANGSVFADLGPLTTDGTTALDAGNLAAPVVTDVDGDGLLDLLVGNENGNVQRFEQLAPPRPTLTGLSPGSGAAGTLVTLTGTNLNGATAVTFAGPATGTFAVVNATTLTVTVPAGATTGNVTVTTPAGTSNGLPFTVYPDLVVSTGGQTIAAGTYHSITVTGAGTGTLAGPVTVTAAVTVQNGGTLNDGCFVLSGAGSFTLAAGGTLGICAAAGISSSGSTGSIQVTGTRSFSPAALYAYQGSAAQTTGTGLPATVDGLTLSNSAGLTLTDDVTATTVVKLTAGVLTTGPNVLTLGPAATLSEDVDGYATGTVQTTRTLNTAGTTEAFGGLGLTLTPSGSRLPGSTLVRRITGTARTGAGTSQSVKRVFDIQPAVSTGLTVALALTVRDDERNGIPGAGLRLFKSDNAGSTWQLQKAATLTPTAASSGQPATYTARLSGISSFSLWTLGNAANPLPVELAQFTAQAEGTGALLRWTTASEANNARFEVESSADGTGFTPLGTVAGAGSSTQAHTYAFTDAHVARYAAPQVYYRLRQVDLDGTASYSPVRLVALTGAGAGLILYPNPAHGEAATLTGAAPGAAVTVLDALGRPVTSATANASGTAVLVLPAGLPAGVYLVRVGSKALRLTVE